VSCAKMVASIEVPFGVQTWVSPRNNVLDGVQDILWEGALLRGVGPMGKLCNSELCNNGSTLSLAVH